MNSHIHLRVLLFLVCLTSFSCGDYIKEVGKPEYVSPQQVPNTVIKGQHCTDFQACATGLACIANPGSTTEGTCQPSTPCSGPLDCASEPANTRCAIVQGIGVKFLQCIKPPSNLSEGKSCTDANACASGLACVANPGSATEGTCKIFVPCNTSQDCASQAPNTACIEVQGIEKNLKQCLTPLQENSSCSSPDVCETGLACIANPGSTTEGICKTFVPCETSADCASQAPNSACIEVQGIKKTLKQCLPPLQENNSCSNAGACDTGLVCMPNPGSTTEGRCKLFTPCSTMEDCASEPTDEACIYAQGMGVKIQKCGQQEDHIGGDIPKGDPCTMVNDCVPGALCIADLGKTMKGTCQAADFCKTNAECTTREKPACITVQGANSMIQVCGKPYCSETAKCREEEVCILAKDDFSKGHCVQQCSDDIDCDGRTDGKTACISPGDLMIKAGNETSVTSPKICMKPRDLEGKLGELGGCDHVDCAPDIICTPKTPSSPSRFHTCKLPCETEGFGKACYDNQDAYCTKILNLKTQEMEWGCTESQFGFERDDSKFIPHDQLDTQACDDSTHLCPRGWGIDYLCVKENSDDTTGRCLELAGGNRICPYNKPMVTVQKDLIITQGEKIADDELKFCR